MRNGQAFDLDHGEGGLAQAIDMVVSSQPHGAMRVALFASLKTKKTVLATKTMISGNMKFSELSATGATPHPNFVAR